MTQVALRRRTRIAAVLLLASSLAFTGFATDQARAGERTRNRAEMLQLTNRARDRSGLDALELDRQLSRYAVRHSRAMADRGELFHSENLAALLGARDWSMGGENVGYASSLSALQTAFMRSTAHRQNILRPGYERTAIGVVQSDGNFWVTVIFYG
jgi:uncharacterized protein YkwD